MKEKRKENLFATYFPALHIQFKKIIYPLQLAPERASGIATFVWFSFLKSEQWTGDVLILLSL